MLENGAVIDGSTPAASGAGLYKATGGPWQAVTIQFFNVHFSGNHAITIAQDDGGGAVYVVGAAELDVVDSRFDDNSGANGGALYSLGSKRVNLFGSDFSGNTATGTGGNPGNGGNGGNGGAIGVDGDARFVNLCDVGLVSNHANAYGGGLFTVTYSADSFTRVHNSTVQGNTSTASDKLAGGAYIQGSPIEIDGSTFRDNTAAGYAGWRCSVTAACWKATSKIRRSSATRPPPGSAARCRSRPRPARDAAEPDHRNNSAPCSVCFDGGIANDTGTGLVMRNVDLPEQHRRQCLQSLGHAAPGSERGENCSGR